MINTKPNTGLKSIFYLVIFLGFYSCDTKETLTFEKQNFATDSLLDCETVDCALLEINLLKVVDGNQISDAINKEIEGVACAILNIGENEPEATMEQAIREFNSSYREISDEFPDEIVPYEASIDCDLSFQCKSLVSVIMDSYIFTGGAHGYGGVSFINIAASTGKQIPNKELFKNYTEFESYAEKAFRKAHKIPEEQSINSTGFLFEDDKFSLPENIGFTQHEVLIYYNPYEISSYAEGPIELKLNKEEVASFFAVEIF